MTIANLYSLFPIFVSAIYLLAAFYAMRKRGFRDLVIQFVVIYMIVSIIWEWVRAGSTYLYYHLALPDNVILHLPYYGLFLLGCILLALTIAFLLNRSPHWGVWAFVFIWLGIVLALDFNWFNLPDILWQDAKYIIDLRSISFYALIFGWGSSFIKTGQVTIKRYRNAKRIVARQRIIYWTLCLILILGSGIFFLLQRGKISSILNLSGIVSGCFIITATRLPDLNLFTKKILSILIVDLLGLFVFATGFWAIQNYFPDLVTISPFLMGISLVLVFLVLVNPLLHVIRKQADRFIVGEIKDTNQVFRDFSQNISNIEDLNQLSNVIVNMISEDLDVKGGVLFTVDLEFGEDGESRYRLEEIPEMEGLHPISVWIPLDSPIAIALGDKQLPLIQSEVEVLPEFRYLTLQERSWLNSQEMEIYVPIHFKDEWIGVLAFGPKISGASFFDEDFEFLTTLANQTSIALQNARLEKSLVRINNEFRRAYSTMEDAHTKLERIDRTKSDFISIVSHEFRTPLTVLSGYSQMLMDDNKFSEDDYYKTIIRGIYEGTTQLHELVDNMLDIAKIDTNELEIQTEQVKLCLVIYDLIQEYSKVFNDRDLSVEIKDIDELPSVQGDPGGLKKVFYHLVMNAVKYTPDGGRIAISGTEINKGDARFPGGGVEIIISDTGIGVDPRYKELIFTKFYQTGESVLHSSGKTKFKGGGPGLGLAIVQGIIKAHGGRVWVESPGYNEKENPGSHFHVLIPFKSG